jgi:hypothetical protein
MLGELDSPADAWMWVARGAEVNDRLGKDVQVTLVVAAVGAES